MHQARLACPLVDWYGRWNALRSPRLHRFLSPACAHRFSPMYSPIYSSVRVRCSTDAFLLLRTWFLRGESPIRAFVILPLLFATDRVFARVLEWTRDSCLTGLVPTISSAIRSCERGVRSCHKAAAVDRKLTRIPVVASKY
eukprot:scaffold3026_cov221-Pinguiococcus_pyrenoidosus.AAC.11